VGTTAETENIEQLLGHCDYLTGKRWPIHHPTELGNRVGYFRVADARCPASQRLGRRYLHPQPPLYYRDVQPITAFILAGGKSTRMGSDKAFLELSGRPLLAHAVALAKAVTDNVKIVGDPDKFAAFGPVVADVYPVRGPLGGIHAALANSGTDWSLILGVDLPFLDAKFLNYLIAEARSSGALVTVAEAGGHVHPLCAVYRKQFLPAAERALSAGRNKIDALFPEVHARVIREEELAKAGFSARIFQNLNTPEEWEKAKSEFAQQAPPVIMGNDVLLMPEMVTTETAASQLPTPSDSSPYIAFDDVSKAFGEKRVLDHVSFYVMTGETVCILGRSGVGKSVALQHILGFLKPDSGRIIVAHEDITGYSEEEMERIRKKVTMVFQSGALFDSLTVGENVAFPLRERRDLSEEQIFQIVNGLLEMVGVKEMADQFPAELSTGMKRSVAIARALASQPECVLYDEPTTMVDPLMANLLGDLMKRLKLQLHLTSIVVTHDMRLAKKLADRVVFLHESKVLFFGTYAAMEKCDEPIVQEFLELDRLDLGA
jgi:phospholipid/cholesterol/gamma-HCH transport system ATP-binding protein